MAWSLLSAIGVHRALLSCQGESVARLAPRASARRIWGACDRSALRPTATNTTSAACAVSGVVRGAMAGKMRGIGPCQLFAVGEDPDHANSASWRGPLAVGLGAHLCLAQSVSALARPLRSDAPCRFPPFDWGNRVRAATGWLRGAGPGGSVYPIGVTQELFLVGPNFPDGTGWRIGSERRSAFRCSAGPNPLFPF